MSLKTACLLLLNLALYESHSVLAAPTRETQVSILERRRPPRRTNNSPNRSSSSKKGPSNQPTVPATNSPVLAEHKEDGASSQNPVNPAQDVPEGSTSAGPSTPSRGKQGKKPKKGQKMSLAELGVGQTPVGGPDMQPQRSQQPPNTLHFTGKDDSGRPAAAAAQDGYENMVGHTLKDNREKMPSVVSALKTPNGPTRLDSSVTGFHTPDGKLPDHIKSDETKKVLQACEHAYGGDHGVGANCGEIRNIDGHFKEHPQDTQIPVGSEFAAYGRLNTEDKTVPPQAQDACKGSGKRNWGCTQTIEMAKTPQDQRLDFVNKKRKDRGESPISDLDQPAKKQKTKRDAYSISDEDLLFLLLARSQDYTF